MPELPKDVELGHLAFIPSSPRTWNLDIWPPSDVELGVFRPSSRVRAVFRTSSRAFARRFLLASYGGLRHCAGRRERAVRGGSSGAQLAAQQAVDHQAALQAAKAVHALHVATNDGDVAAGHVHLLR